MSSGNIDVDFDGVNSAITQLDTKFDEMINHVATLSRDLREVGPAMDSPQTRPAFEEIMNEWTQRVPRLMETQRNTTTALRNMVQQHQQADRTQSEQARSQLGSDHMTRGPDPQPHPHADGYEGRIHERLNEGNDEYRWKPGSQSGEDLPPWLGPRDI